MSAHDEAVLLLFAFVGFGFGFLLGYGHCAYQARRLVRELVEMEIEKAKEDRLL